MPYEQHAVQVHHLAIVRVQDVQGCRPAVERVALDVGERTAVNDGHGRDAFPKFVRRLIFVRPYGAQLVGRVVERQAPAAVDAFQHVQVHVAQRLRNRPDACVHRRHGHGVFLSYHRAGSGAHSVGGAVPKFVAARVGHTCARAEQAADSFEHAANVRRPNYSVTTSNISSPVSVLFSRLPNAMIAATTPSTCWPFLFLFFVTLMLSAGSRSMRTHPIW